MPPILVITNLRESLPRITVHVNYNNMYKNVKKASIQAIFSHK